MRPSVENPALRGPSGLVRPSGPVRSAVTARCRTGLAGVLGAMLLPGLALAEVPRVVTDIAPVHSLVAQVMEGIGAPVQLMEQGADAHHFSMRPSQARALQQADLVVWIGPEMTPWLGAALETAPGRRVLSLLAAEGTERMAYAGAHDHSSHGAEAAADHADHDHAGHDHDHSEHGHDHDHADHDHADHGHDHDHAGAEGQGAAGEASHDHAGHAGHGHSHEGIDPHAWLNPGNAVAWLDLIAEDLAKLDPENAARYRSNAETARRGVIDLDARIAAELAPHADKPFVVAHEAYGYFASRFDLHLAGAIAGGDAAAPGAARLKALRDEVKAEGAVCAFPEVGREARLVALVVEGSDTRLGAALDPEGREIAPGPALYATLMQRLSGAIAACLSAQG